MAPVSVAALIDLVVEVSKIAYKFSDVVHTVHLKSMYRETSLEIGMF